MNKYFYTVGLVFCILLAFSGVINLVQDETMKEIVVIMLAPLKKWYVALPIGICSIGFGTSLMYNMFDENSKKSKECLMLFSLGSFTIYISATLLIMINEMIKGL
ncbi:hypothetical protein BC30048_p1287 (plasmid) [Bacillus cereus]|uniref:hypothetical protein n=1 Tax=Bacillus cereus TaxID=1396 RepID=UPI001F1B09C9|nr:hypothetical protein [Bacillus cereus]BCD02778.1 hypothetical protein BC30048_p1287 [Bacillus cereus]